jgi:hypothetical protein
MKYRPSGKIRRQRSASERARRYEHHLSRGGRPGGTDDNRLHPTTGAALTRTPAPTTTGAAARPHLDAPPTAQPPNHAGARPDASLPDDGSRLLPAVDRVRLCILCDRPLRAGQHMLRVHGSTIHARCSNIAT